MAILTTQPFGEAVLSTTSAADDYIMHVFEPEFHQDIYRKPAEDALNSPHGSFQLDDAVLTKTIHRGSQPRYVDDLDDPDTLAFIGMMSPTGKRLDSDDTSNVAAIKSVGVRSGFVDIDSSRAVEKDFYETRKSRVGIQKNDLLINSTGDGTIGRVAVYHYDFPAVVDGHISILRFKNPITAWYTAAYLLSDPGQHQIYRYINGSSGQVEIYPQDLARLVIPKLPCEQMEQIAKRLQTACSHFAQFRDHLGGAIAEATDAHVATASQA